MRNLARQSELGGDVELDAEGRQGEPSDAPGGQGRSELKSGAAIGLVSGFAAITCCVSPVVFVLIGIATAAEAVTLGDTLYYTYGWFFRAFGAVVAAAAVIVYLRRRRGCSIDGARRHWRTLGSLVLAGGATYAGLFWFTKYLSIWFA